MNENLDPTDSSYTNEELEIDKALRPLSFDDLANINVVITVFALLAGAAQLVFLYNFIHSMFFGKKAEQNPWRSNTMEWTAPVEHIHGNWPGKIPHVHRWAYDYSKPGQDEDFVLQTTPIQKGEIETEH